MTHALLARLDDIGQSLEKSGHALALIGLGSSALKEKHFEINRAMADAIRQLASQT